MTALGLVFLMLGIFILLLAGVGLFSLPDALSRQHAATKAGALGLVSMLSGTALLGGDGSWVWRALLIILLVWLTMPVASHVLARAAMRENPVMDDGGSDDVFADDAPLRD
ncbi:sodium/proton antiporter complex Mrp, protein G [Syntrophotalea carbinolica DSM 2380]|uniref:Sodium/proton antiporter complex Mrp, protein G n=1 Tax=Syntrophotalea carbinolica (strain DSM 2380 / NBRC 103641 / GraBd1) TaxID=338963 RepID=Q3A1A3_SYNC1|nr:monovalent cation/H(+) antiporter subunit G [Syntrophotalea carbinolica]ABA89854.1 sodium/proton antiporter complex Mrp, protein G [Syntrophotalea carbinolica DSM 2380]